MEDRVRRDLIICPEGKTLETLEEHDAIKIRWNSNRVKALFLELVGKSTLCTSTVFTKRGSRLRAFFSMIQKILHTVHHP